jgi:aspartyl-tRNA(Asn)/glutamyl-tRNA(Gln) amidotransferase subunit C
MEVTRDDVRKIATLARLRPQEEAVERLTRELNGILGHIRLLEEVDVAGAEEARWRSVDRAPTRDPALPRDALAEGAPGTVAPDWKEGFFAVPRVPALDGGATAASPEGP